MSRMARVAATIAALSPPGASARVTAPRSMAMPADSVIWMGPWIWKARPVACRTAASIG